VCTVRDERFLRLRRRTSVVSQDPDPGEDAGADETADWRDDPDPDPPSLGPGIPEVDVPEVGTSDSLTGDVDPEVARTFWRLVVVLDVGLLAVALGPMFVYFEGNWELGLSLAGFGVAVLAYGVVQYRQYRAEDPPDGPERAESPESATEDPKG
jgi:hypothetical protein